MGSSSYVSVADPARPGHSVFLQFLYGFRREIEYAIGDEIQWALDELPPTANSPYEIIVPAWTMGTDTRHFALTILDNRISGAREISEEQADLLETGLEIDTYHAWKKQ